jgi:hypothetical protein
MMRGMESPDVLDIATIRASCAAAAPVAPATVAGLCDALEAARGELLARDGEAARTAKRLEIAEAARRTAEVERSRFYLQLSAARAECHAVAADPAASDAERAVAKRVLAASRRKA